MTRRQFLVSAGCLAAAASARAVLPNERIRMLAIGDSITEGRRAGPEEGFVSLLARRLPEMDVVNLGCGGATSRDWIAAAPGLDDTRCSYGNARRSLLDPALPAQLFHVLLGTNDAMGFGEATPDSPFNFVSPDEYERNLRTLIWGLPGLVLLSVPPMPASWRRGDALHEFYGGLLREYRSAVFRIVGDQPEVVLGGDFIELLDSRKEMHGIHPNAPGHAAMAGEIERGLLAVLPREVARDRSRLDRAAIARARRRLWLGLR